ncbi:MAG: hypothetical protein IJT14_00595 [Rickettsiales bacterium]|nr:hypothetical protein [Rickettsiales bacterium]
MKFAKIVLVLFIVVAITGCESIKKQYVKSEVKNTALNLTGMKEGKACKYLGFIGNNSEAQAKKNGNIRFVLYKTTEDGTFSKCTYVYGR